MSKKVIHILPVKSLQRVGKCAYLELTFIFKQSRVMTYNDIGNIKSL